MGCDGGSLLVATAGYDANVYHSARNIEGVSVAPATELNAFSVLRPKRVLVTKAALDALVASAQERDVGGEAAANGEKPVRASALPRRRPPAVLQRRKRLSS